MLKVSSWPCLTPTILFCSVHHSIMVKKLDLPQDINYKYRFICNLLYKHRSIGVYLCALRKAQSILYNRLFLAANRLEARAAAWALFIDSRISLLIKSKFCDFKEIQL